VEGFFFTTFASGVRTAVELQYSPVALLNFVKQSTESTIYW